MKVEGVAPEAGAEVTGGEGEGAEGVAPAEGSAGEAAGGEGEGQERVSLLDGEAPESLRVWEEVLDEEKKDSFSVDPAIIDELPDAGKQLLTNFRRAYQNKARDLAELRKETQLALEEAREERRKVAQERAKLSDVFNSPELLQLLKGSSEKDPSQLDPFTPEGIQALGQKSAADFMKQVIERITEKSQEEAKRYEAEQRRAEITAFADANPDFESDELFPTIKQLCNAGIDYREAYQMAKGRLLVTKEEQAKREREEARQLIRTPARRTAKVPLPKADANADELLAHLDAHPEAAAALAKMKPSW